MSSVEFNYLESDWNRMELLKPFNSEVDSGTGLCLLTKIQNDLQRIFDHLSCKFSKEGEYVISKNILKKGSIFEKGDFFLSLKSSRVFFMPDAKEELLVKVNSIPYILESHVDDCGNLILCLNRTVLFNSVLKDVMRYGKNYGMKTKNVTYLILVHNEVFKNFDALRIALVANHLISFLTATGAKVYVNEYRRNAELLFKEVPVYTCTDHCMQQIKILSKLVENSVQELVDCGSKWISVTGPDNVCIDLKKFAKTSSFPCVKDAGDISIIKDKPNVVINQGAYILHFNLCHASDPDCVIHICLQNEKRKITEAGLLIKMLRLIDVPQYFIACQSTHLRIEPEVTIDTFINHEKKEIENAMKDKYNSDVLKNEVWENYLKALVDTTVKFSFLKTGTNDSLKIDLNFSKNVSRKNKDGIFIQYNFARLSNLLRIFELKVEEGYYENLPLLDNIDFGLLKFEEEWNLLNFVLAFPKLVEEIFLTLESKQTFPVNKVQIMLTELCHSVSKYYSRIHILGVPQPQLQKVMHARIWLLKGVLQILYNSFVLLNIQGLTEM